MTTALSQPKDKNTRKRYYLACLQFTQYHTLGEVYRIKTHMVRNLIKVSYKNPSSLLHFPRLKKSAQKRPGM